MSDPLPPDLEPPNFEPPNFEPPASTPAGPAPWAAPGTTAPMEPAEPATEGRRRGSRGSRSESSRPRSPAARSSRSASRAAARTRRPARRPRPPPTRALRARKDPERFGNGPTLVTRRGVRGTIAAIDGTTLTLDSTDPSGDESTVTVETTDETAFRETVEGTLADIAVGDNIVAIGTASDAGISAANIIDIGDDAAGTDFRAGGPPLRPRRRRTPPSFPTVGRGWRRTGRGPVGAAPAASRRER